MTITQRILARSAGLYINLLSYANPQKATAEAYRLFSSPRSGRFDEGLPELLQPQKHKVLEHAGHTFQTYHWKGNERTVLLVHGWESNAARWEKLLPYLLEAGYSIVAFDAPGHGMSSGKQLSLPLYAQTISHCVETFKPDFLVGHSIGAAASLLSQHESPSPVLRKMALLGTPSDMRVVLDNFLGLLGLNDRSRKLMEDYFVSTFKKGIDEYTSTKFCRTVTLPTLLAHDELDDVVSYNEALKIVDAWPSAQFITTKGLGHSMHDDKLYRKLVEFLQ